MIIVVDVAVIFVATAIAAVAAGFTVVLSFSL